MGLELPGYARRTWERGAPALRLMGSSSPGVELGVGGGTILAARWNHRESTDVDVTTRGVPTLWPYRKGGPQDIGALTGGEHEIFIDELQEHHIRVLYDCGALDVSRLKVEPVNGSERTEIEGIAVSVLSTTQILWGKVDRIRKRRTARDVYDVAASARMDPASLAEAVGRKTEEEINRSIERIIEEHGSIREEMERRVKAKPGFGLGKEDAILEGVRALDGHRTVRLSISRTGRGLTMERTLKNAGQTRRTGRIERLEEFLEAHGVDEWMNDKSPGGMAIVRRNAEEYDRKESKAPAVLFATENRELQAESPRRGKIEEAISEFEKREDGKSDGK